MTSQAYGRAYDEKIQGLFQDIWDLMSSARGPLRGSNRNKDENGWVAEEKGKS